MEALAASAALFEVSVPEYKQLKMCRKELRLLKDLWDMVTLVCAQPWEQGTVPSPASGHGLDSRLLVAGMGTQHRYPVQVPGTGTWCQLPLPTRAAELLQLFRELIAIRGRMSHGAGCYS